MRLDIPDRQIDAVGEGGTEKPSIAVMQQTHSFDCGLGKKSTFVFVDSGKSV